MLAERVDLRAGDCTMPLFNDEDGSSHLELTHLLADDRVRVRALLAAHGFRE